MKQLLLLTAYLILMCACRKEQQTAPPAGEKKVRIDKFELTQYDNVALEASFEGITEGAVQLKGFTWSVTPERPVEDSLYKIYSGEPFKAQINAIGQNSKIYIWAFVETNQGIYFSDSIVINTSGLQLLWNREYANAKRRVKQVIASGNDGLLALIERYDVVYSWPELMKLDTAGNIIWTREYYVKELKTPQYLMPVADGYVMAASQGFRNEDGIVVFKTDLTGTRLWEKIFKHQTNEDFIRMTVLPDQTMQLTTRSYNGIVNDKLVNVFINDYIFNGNGQMISTTSVPNNTLFSNRSSNPIKALTTPDGGFVSVAELHPMPEIVATKFNNANQMLWEHYRMRYIREELSLSVNNAGNYIVRGSRLSNAVVMEMDNFTGDLLWQYEFNNWKYRSAFGKGALAVGNGGYYITAEASLLLRPYAHGSLLFKLGMKGEFLYDFMQAVPDNLHYTDALVVNSNKEIYLFGTRMQYVSDRTSELFIIKLKER